MREYLITCARISIAFVPPQPFIPHPHLPPHMRWLTVNLLTFSPSPPLQIIFCPKPLAVSAKRCIFAESLAALSGKLQNLLSLAKILRYEYKQTH